MVDSNELDMSNGPLHGYRGGETEVSAGVPLGLTLAISRESGARGGSIGRRVGKKLGWQVFDQEMLQFVSKEDPTPLDVPEDIQTQALAWIHDQWKVIEQQVDLSQDATLESVTRLILHLAVGGNVVLIGRGAGFLLPRETTLHVRLVSPLEKRVDYLSQWLRLTPEEGQERVRSRDEHRNEYLTNVLRCDPNQMNQYDMVLNSATLGEDLCVDLLSRAAQERISKSQFEFSESSNDDSE